MAQEMDILSHTLFAVTVYTTMIVIAQKLGDNTTHQQARKFFDMTSVSHAYRLGPKFSPCLTFNSYLHMNMIGCVNLSERWGALSTDSKETAGFAHLYTLPYGGHEALNSNLRQGAGL